MSFEEFQDGRQNDFNKFKSLCYCDASHQVSAQSDLAFGRSCHLKSFKMAHGGHLGYQNGTTLAILNLHVATMPPTNFQLNPTDGSGIDVENVKSLRRTDDGQQAIA